ncbi:superoxide dismutase [Mycena olivaceomarginata]|nr:superoxide dismutase [Mycena olivaceomarginata]
MTYPKKQSNYRGWWIAGAAAVGLLFLFWNSRGSESFTPVTKAVVVLKGDSQATGTVTFEQRKKSVVVTGELRNLDPLALRGFHIHQSGDLTNGCLSAGPHFNPFGKNHGAPSDTERHVGQSISLNGPLSIVGWVLLLQFTLGTDDLGRGDDDESLKTGNAGARAACWSNRIVRQSFCAPMLPSH